MVRPARLWPARREVMSVLVANAVEAPGQSIDAPREGVFRQEVTRPGAAVEQDHALDVLSRRVFWQSRMLSRIEKAAGRRIVRIGLFDGSRVIAGLAGADDAGGLWRIPTVPYQGICFAGTDTVPPHRAEQHREEATGELGRMLPRRYSRGCLDLEPEFVDARPMIRAGWVVEPRYTYISDLSSDPRSRVSPAVRRRARRAAAAGVSFDAQVAPAEFASLWVASQERRRLRPELTAEQLTALLTALTVDDDTCIVVGSRLACGRLVAAVAMLFDPQWAYFWLSGFDPDEPFRGASNQLCHLEMLALAAERVSRLDWVGANTPGVAEYKRSFGPTLIQHHRVRFGQGSVAAAPGMSWRDWIRCCPLLNEVRPCRR